MTKRVFMLPCGSVSVLELMPSPSSCWRVTGISLHFRPGAAAGGVLLARIHNVAGVILVGLYAAFVIGNIVTGNWWQYAPKPPGIIQRCLRQMQYYGLASSRAEPEPFPPTRETNFNALQAPTGRSSCIWCCRR